MAEALPRVDTVLEVTRVITSSLRLDRVLEAVLEQGMRALAAEAGTVWLLDRGGGRLVPAVALGPRGEAVKGMWLRPGEGIAGAAVAEQRGFRVENVRQSPQWAARFDRRSGFTTRSLLCVPLIYRDRAIGALQFVNKCGGQAFSGEDLALASALAGQAAVAIGHSRAFEEQVVRAQEEERRRIARDIHDGPAQVLAGLIMRAEICQRLLAADPGRAGAELEVIQRGLRESVQELRGIIFQLRPQALDQLGLVPGLRAYLEGVTARGGPATTLTVGGRVRRLPPALEVTLYRVVQEAVTNAVKHSRAATVAVRVRFGTRTVEVAVEDDGVGFDVEAVRGRGGDHYGLAGMEERVQLMDGRMKLESAPGRGTRLACSFPMPAGEWRLAGRARRARAS